MRKFGIILCWLVQLLSIVAIIWASVVQINLQIEKFGFFLIREWVFIPDVSAWGYLGIPAFILSASFKSVLKEEGV